MAEADEMRILFVSDHLGYAGGMVHGATTYFLQALPRLARRDNIALTCCFLRQRHEASERLEAGGVRPMFFNRHKWDMRALGDLVRVVRQRRIEVIHAAGFKGMLLSRIAARLTGARCVIHLHDAEQRKGPLRWIQKGLRGWTNAAIGVSDDTCAVAQHTFGISPDRVHCLHNAMDLSASREVEPSARAAVRDELSIPQNAPVIGMIGRFVPVKNHPDAIRALALTRRTVTDLMLVCVGDGPERARCERLAEQYGVRHAVRFAGHRSDVSRVLASIDALVMCSKSEGLPFAGIEALAAGVPIVAYRAGGLPELVLHDVTGLLVPAGDVEGLASSMTRMLTDHERRRRLSEGARSHSETFDIDHHVDCLVSLYRQVLGRAGRVRSRQSRVHDPVAVRAGLTTAPVAFGDVMTSAGQCLSLLM